MKVRITAPSGGFMSGSAARLFLDDVDVSQYVKRIVLTVDSEEAIGAELTFFLTAVDVDVPAVIKPLIGKATTTGYSGKYVDLGDVELSTEEAAMAERLIAEAELP